MAETNELPDICGVCKSEIDADNSKVLKCSGVCNFMCHVECSTLKKSERILLSNENFFYFCDECKVIGFNVNSLLISLKNAVISCQNMILQQTNIINRQSENINTLRNEVKLLGGRVGHLPENNALPLDCPAPEVDADPKSNNATFSEVVRCSRNITNNTGHKTNQSTFNSNNGVQDVAVTRPAENVAKKDGNKYKQKKLIIGKKIESAMSDAPNEDDGFVAIKRTRKCNIHITRVKPSVGIEKVQNYIQTNLKNNNVDLECVASLSLEKLNSKHPENYSSFKLSIDSTVERVLLDPSFWPDGIAVRNFITGPTKKPMNFPAGQHPQRVT